MGWTKLCSNLSSCWSSVLFQRMTLMFYTCFLRKIFRKATLLYQTHLCYKIILSNTHLLLSLFFLEISAMILVRQHLPARPTSLLEGLINIHFILFLKLKGIGRVAFHLVCNAEVFNEFLWFSIDLLKKSTY